MTYSVAVNGDQMLGSLIYQKKKGVIATLTRDKDNTRNGVSTAAHLGDTRPTMSATTRAANSICAHAYTRLNKACCDASLADVKYINIAVEQPGDAQAFLWQHDTQKRRHWYISKEWK